MKFVGVILGIVFYCNAVLAQQKTHKKYYLGYSDNRYRHNTNPQSKDRIKRMNYFIGKWDLKLSFASNTTGKPDINATWTLQRDIDSFSLSGFVSISNNPTTKETITYDPNMNYIRDIIADDSTHVFFMSKGWKKDQLVWQGIVHNPHSTLVMREVIKKVSDNEFHAVYYQRKKQRWQEIQTEVLKRITP